MVRIPLFERSSFVTGKGHFPGSFTMEGCPHTVLGGVGSTMHSVLVVAIVFGGIVLALAIIGSTILMAIKILRGGFSRKGQKLDADETGMIQEIYQGLSRMEERVEALETIILDSKGKDSES